MSSATYTELLERERELVVIRESLAAAQTHSGSALVLEGPPGVGKTRLLAESCTLAGELGFTVLSAVGGELERDFPYGVARQLFEPALTRAPARDRVALLDGAARFASPALGLGSEAVGESQDDAEFAVVHGLYWLAANFAASGPLLIAVDDAHWVDTPSLRYLSYLTRRIADLQAVLVVASRPAETDPRALGAVAGNPGVRVLRPKPLSAAAVAALIRARLGECTDDELCRACHTATAGNPFFVIELLRALEEEQLAPGADATRRVRALGAGAVSDTVFVRLTRLPADAQAIAKAAAVLGAAAPLGHVATLAELDEDRSSAAVDTLAAAAILRPGRPLEFVHPVMREAVYQRLSDGERARAHWCAANLLADWGGTLDEVATHLLHADPAGAAWAVEALRDAARGALARGAPEAAAVFLERALIEPPTRGMRSEVLRELGVTELRAGRLAATSAQEQEPTAITHLREAVALADHPRAGAIAARDLADALWACDRFPEAMSTLERAIADVGEADAPLALGLEAHLVAVGWLDRSNWSLVSPRLDGVAQLAGKTPAERLLLGMLALRGLLDGEPASVVAGHAERALANQGISEGLTPQAVNFPGIALYCCDRLHQAEQAFSTRIAEARKHGEIRAVAALLCWRAETLRRQGRLSDAETDAREAIAISEERNWSIAMPGTRGVLADTLLDQGDPQRALTVLDGPVTPTGYWSWNVFLLARGRARVAAGDVRTGLEDLLEAGARQQDWGPAAPALLPWRSTAARAHAALGNTEQARALVRDELDLARRFGAPRALAIAMSATAAVDGGDRGVEILREAADVLKDSPAVLDLGATLVELGSALRRSGQRAAARDPLRRGLDIAHRLGAQVLAAHAREELLASGARPRRLLLTGAAALTPSERRIARMAAQELTNREIAQALFVSQRTVETHLSHCYQKLDITTRSQLKDALEAG
jgi:DNA-binding CsgD family transcriptional regulator